MATYKTDEKLAEIAARVMEKYPETGRLEDQAARIGYLWCDKAKKNGTKVVFADAEKVKEKYSAFLDLDFIVTFYEPNCAGFTDEQLERLMYHELLHAGYDGGEPKIERHTVEDFRECIERWGVDWLLN